MTFTVPTWLCWILYAGAFIWAAAHFGRSQGDYDFVSGFIGIAIVAAGVAFALGVAAQRWLF